MSILEAIILETAKKGYSVHYLLTSAEWEGGMKAVRQSTGLYWSPSVQNNCSKG
ncbi:8469_t:CDS:2, partial [Rhizophagus irregularis]